MGASLLLYAQQRNIASIARGLTAPGSRDIGLRFGLALGSELVGALVGRGGGFADSRLRLAGSGLMGLRAHGAPGSWAGVQGWGAGFAGW